MGDCKPQNPKTPKLIQLKWVINSNWLSQNDINFVFVYVYDMKIFILFNRARYTYNMPGSLKW